MTQSIYSRDTVRDILIAACEGGIGYWSQITKLSYSRITVTLKEWNEDTNTWNGAEYSLTYRDILRGFKRAIEYGYIKDVSDMDSTDADVVIQLAIFNDVVYG